MGRQSSGRWRAQLSCARTPHTSQHEPCCSKPGWVRMQSRIPVQLHDMAEACEHVVADDGAGTACQAECG